MSSRTTTATPCLKIAPRKRRVQLGERVFYVGRMPDGSPLNIMERRLRRNGRIGNSTYWHRTHRLGGPNTMVRRILGEAGFDNRHLTGH